jgi:hypothetical protein
MSKAKKSRPAIDSQPGVRKSHGVRKFFILCLWDTL